MGISSVGIWSITANYGAEWTLDLGSVIVVERVTSAETERHYWRTTQEITFRQEFLT